MSTHSLLKNSHGGVFSHEYLVSQLFIMSAVSLAMLAVSSTRPSMNELGGVFFLVNRSFEMSEVMYSKRLASSITKIPMIDLRGQSQTLKQLLEETKQQKKNSCILIKEFPPSTITPGQVSAFIKKLKQSGFSPDAIVLDYLNLISAPYGDNSYERVKVVSEKVRALSYEFECPIISATQINRTGYGVDQPGLETISESTGLAATADAIFSIWQNDEDKDMGIVNLGIVKSRFGPNFGSTPLRIDYHTLTISEDNIVSGTAESLDFTRSLNQLVDT